MFSVARYVCFRSRVGVLSDYIDFWMKEKIRATEIGDESLRFLSKRYLNSPYGKMGMRQDRINKIPELTPEGDIHFINHEDTTEGIYLPYATFVTAAARSITLRAAQKCYEDKIMNEKGEECDSF